MTKETLSRMQAPLKEKYRRHPATARATLRARAVVGEEVSCTSVVGEHEIETGLHPGAGGSPRNVCPATVFLDSLASCAGITLAAVATHMGIPIRNATVCAEGDLDLRGTLGVSEDVQVGFTDIRIRVDFGSDLPRGQGEVLLSMMEKYCVVYQTMRRAPRIVVEGKSSA